ncbi:hypothetical protein QBC46DRAFT_398840 [Diplogelasinospora grovesii]|uniref:Uncharacterized protein n=1 Tax=Diplogelasinospora grovesii TaxID=303347 RepID=A0AAN6MWM8_9PEZI|nr:hypothetical protein QBC46DRAFT_398840 [Diplogelasinospora grovesii]
MQSQSATMTSAPPSKVSKTPSYSGPPATNRANSPPTPSYQRPPQSASGPPYGPADASNGSSYRPSQSNSDRPAYGAPDPNTGLSYNRPDPNSTSPYDRPPEANSGPSYRPSDPNSTASYNRPPDNSGASYRPSDPNSAGPRYNRPPISTGLSYGAPPPGAPGQAAGSTVSFAPPPNGTHSFPPPPNSQGPLEQMSGPAAMSTTSLPVSTTTTNSGKRDLQDSKSTTEFALREYMSMQRRRYKTDEVGIEERLRIQASTVLGDLRALRKDVSELVKDAESHRWRRFIFGGAIATFIPAIKAIFRKPRGEKNDDGSSNNTEYAFRKSKNLIARIMGYTRRPGLATVAFFVFAVLYVFQNEVTLRVARTVHKRLKRLSAKVEEGREEIDEKDLEMLRGWRWRILMWA